LVFENSMPGSLSVRIGDHDSKIVVDGRRFVYGSSRHGEDFTAYLGALLDGQLPHEFTRKAEDFSMVLREDVEIAFLRMKELMIESDHNAVFKDGRKLPVFIYQQRGKPHQLCVEIEDEGKFFVANTMPGFIGFEVLPEIRAERESELAKREENAPKN